MSAQSGSVDGKDDTIGIAGVCQDHGDHGSKYTLIIEQFLPTTSKLSYEWIGVPLMYLLHPSLLRQNTSLRDCIPAEKVLALGLYRLAHGNSYSTIGANFGVGKSMVIEAVQDVTEALFDLRNEYIKFPVTEAETIASIETFS